MRDPVAVLGEDVVVRPDVGAPQRAVGRERVDQLAPPDHIKEGRFGKWLEHNVDWALSRDRYWGTPLPVWRCEVGHDTCIGSVAELSERAGRDLSDTDLHRPYVDEVTFTCAHGGCQAEARRLPPVLDGWFDSGSVPSAQHHHPFADDGAFEAAFPADFICEAIDQTRGWFYSLLAVNTLVFDATPYRNVVCLGFIVDAEGRKMSKSRGNVLDPWHVFDTQGADALRWYFFSAGQPWSSRRVFEDGIRETTRQTLLTLWNVFSFFATYADLDGWEPAPGWSPASEAPAADHVLDRWILAEVDDAVGRVTAALEDYDALTAAQRLARLVDDLSNWYVRRSRPRFWKASDPLAHATLHHCLVRTAQLLAPFTPFLADELWGALTGELSVHAADWPVADVAEATGLSEEMAAARTLVALGRAARTDAKVRTRQPLRRALILHPDVELSDEVRAEIAEELNVKELHDVDTLGELVTWRVVPNFRALGPRLGPKVNEVKAALAAADGSALHRALETEGHVEVDGVVLGPEDVEVRAERHGDLALAQDGAWAVALDVELDAELVVEGTARELVRMVNDQRKEQGLRHRRPRRGDHRRARTGASGGGRPRHVDRRRGARHLAHLRRRGHRRHLGCPRCRRPGCGCGGGAPQPRLNRSSRPTQGRGDLSGACGTGSPMPARRPVGGRRPGRSHPPVPVRAPVAADDAARPRGPSVRAGRRR